MYTGDGFQPVLIADSTINDVSAVDYLGFEIAEKYSINLSLETDLAPRPFSDLLNRFNSNQVTVNYDIGNSASLGYDPVEELDAYGDKITDIHIKDRVFGGGPVILGQGDADFDKFFNKLKKFNYQGAFIMQAYRDEEGVEVFKEQLTWIKPYLSHYL
jgi:sugar phosphate isomerase/epimerase